MNKKVSVGFQKLFRNKVATFAFVLIIIIVLASIFAPLLTKFNPIEEDVASKFKPGFWDMANSDGHLLGTDNLGRDTFARVLYGTQTTLLVSLTATSIGIIFGVFFGLLAGYYPKLDSVIMRVMDILFTFPGILLAMLIVAMMGASTFNAMLAIAIWAIPGFARMVRGKVLSIKEEEYITAIKALGANDFRIIVHHLLPNVFPTIIVITTMRLASSIMSIATLSYLGLGTPPPHPELGGMISVAKEFMYEQPSLIIIPGVVVMICVICFNLIGDKLSDILDPNLKDNL